MKSKILIALALLLSTIGIAQPLGSYTDVFIYGHKMKRLIADSSLHLPHIGGLELGDSIKYNLYNIKGAIAITDSEGQIVYSTDGVKYNARLLDLRDTTWLKDLKGNQALDLTIDSFEADQVTYINPILDNVPYLVFKNSISRYLDSDEWDIIGGGGFELEDSVHAGDRIILIGEIRFNQGVSGSGGGSGILTYQELQNLEADISNSILNNIALVYDDSDITNNGFYRYDGSEWVKITYVDLPGNDIDLFEQE